MRFCHYPMTTDALRSAKLSRVPNEEQQSTARRDPASLGSATRASSSLHLAIIHAHRPPPLLDKQSTVDRTDKAIFLVLDCWATGGLASSHHLEWLGLRLASSLTSSSDQHWPRPRGSVRPRPLELHFDTPSPSTPRSPWPHPTLARTRSLSRSGATASAALSISYIPTSLVPRLFLVTGPHHRPSSTSTLAAQPRPAADWQSSQELVVYAATSICKLATPGRCKQQWPRLVASTTLALHLDGDPWLGPEYNHHAAQRSPALTPTSPAATALPANVDSTSCLVQNTTARCSPPSRHKALSRALCPSAR